MGNDLKTSNYVMPTAQEHLNGALGLVSSEIAKSLGVTPSQVRQKLRRGDWFKNKHLAPVAYATLNENGVLHTDYVLSVPCALAFVARWVNAIGDGYLMTLLEDQKKIEMLEAENAAMKQKFMKPRKGTKNVTIHSFRYLIDLFGKVQAEVIKEKKPHNELTPEEHESWLFTHLIAINEGIGRRLKKKIHTGKILPFAPPRLIEDNNGS